MQHTTRLLLILLFISGIISGTSAQVVISSTSPAPTEDGSAVLELISPDMGLLIPKVTIDDLTTADPVSSPAPGLLVYNLGGGTVPNNTVEGFYFWDGSKWTEVINDKRVFANEQFGELYEIVSGGTPKVVNLGTSGIWTGWKTAEEGILSDGMTADTTHAFADQMFISRYGLYNIQLAMSVGGSQNQQITSSVWVIDAATSTPTETRIKVFSKMGSQGALISGSSIGVLELFPGDILDLRFTSNSSGETLNIYSINLIVTKVGE